MLGAGAGRRGRTRPSRPSSISRTTSPPRTSARRCTKACARSSMSSASPPTAWRPTRARPPTCTGWPSPPRRSARQIPEVGLTTFRAPYTPVTFGAIVNHARGPLFDPTRKTRDPCLGRGAWRGVRGCRPVEARLVFPASRRGHACRGQPRMRDRARQSAGLFDASTLGKIEVVGPDAAKFMELLYTNPWEKLEPGRCRYGIMLREDGFIYDDGVVGRLAPRPLPCHHDDRRRAARHEPYGGLSPDRVPGSQRLADLDHRAMGGHRRAGAEVARHHRAAGRRHRHVGRGDAAYVGARGQDLRRADPAVPHVASPASAASRSTCRPTTARPCGKRCGPKARSTAPAPTAPRPCTCCAPRRATSSSARTPTAR